MSGLNFTEKGGAVPDDEGFGKSETSGNFLIGRPALFPFGGMEVDGFDGNEDVWRDEKTM